MYIGVPIRYPASPPVFLLAVDKNSKIYLIKRLLC